MSPTTFRSNSMGFAWPDHGQDTTEHVVTAIKNIVASVATNETSTDFEVTESPAVIINSETSSSLFTEISTNNNVSGIFSTTMNSIVNALSNDTVSISTNSNLVTDSPNIGETFSANSTSVPNLNLTEASNNNSIITSFVTDNSSSAITTTAENVLNTISSTTEKIVSSVNENQFLNHHEDHDDGDELSPTIYVILGVILALLIIIIISLVLVYKKYGNGTFTFKSGDYSITQLKDVSSTSSNEKSTCDIKQQKI